MARVAKRFTVDVRKVDHEKRLVFGWASVVTKAAPDGSLVPVVDLQDDIIPVDVLEDAVYRFMLKSRDVGDMHVRKGAGAIIESCVFSREKQQALGIDLGFEGWWIGAVCDNALWEAVKSGERPAFSVGGTGVVGKEF